MALRLDAIDALPLAVPLLDPFIIATGRVDETQSALVTARGGGIFGVGEAATLWPVTKETRDDVLVTLQRAANDLAGLDIGSLDAITDALGPLRASSPCAAAGVESALVDLLARSRGVSAKELLGGDEGRRTSALTSDMTLPILGAAKMAELARGWRARGFTCFKVKVGADLDGDVRALEAVARAVPDARFRIDANAAFDAADAIALARAGERLSLAVECYEQPCAKDDLDGMARVAEALAVLAIPLIADESVANEDDLARVRAARAADGINLKLVKSGGPIATFALGRAAKRAGMRLMIGGMVETRLGMSAAAHVACALGGVDFVDLDTAWLLARDPFRGGYDADGPRYAIPAEIGFGVSNGYDARSASPK